MKNIIVAGTGRAGKSTLARKIHDELGYFVINNDKLVVAFGEAYPQLNIRIGNGEMNTANIAPFLGHFLGLFSSPDGEGLFPFTHGALGNNPFVLEGAHFDFAQIADILKKYGIRELKERFILIGLVVGSKSVSSFVGDMKKYDTEFDWTYGFGEAELSKVAEDSIIYSKQIAQDLQKYGFRVYDTSIEREQILDRIVAEIKAQIGE